MPESLDQVCSSIDYVHTYTAAHPDFTKCALCAIATKTTVIRVIKRRGRLHTNHYRYAFTLPVFRHPEFSLRNSSSASSKNQPASKITQPIGNCTDSETPVRPSRVNGYGWAGNIGYLAKYPMFSVTQGIRPYALGQCVENFVGPDSFFCV